MKQRRAGNSIPRSHLTPSEPENIVDGSALGAARTVYIRVVCVNKRALFTPKNFVLAGRWLKPFAPEIVIDGYDGEGREQRHYVKEYQFIGRHGDDWAATLFVAGTSCVYH